MSERAEKMKAKYGEGYYSELAKKVKSRKGFHTRGKEFAKAAQKKSVEKKNLSKDNG